MCLMFALWFLQAGSQSQQPVASSGSDGWAIAASIATCVYAGAFVFTIWYVHNQLKELSLQRQEITKQTDAVLETARASRDAAFETRRAAQATLFSELLTEYASPLMTVAKRELSRWQEDNPTDFAERFINLLRSRDARGDRIDDHRRYVYRYFYKVRHFAEAGLIEVKLVDDPLFCNPTAAKLVLDVLEPLQKAHGKAITDAPYDKKTFDYYLQNFHLKKS